MVPPAESARCRDVEGGSRAPAHPTPACRRALQDAGFLDPETDQRLEGDVAREIQEAIRAAQQAPEPSPEALYQDLYVSMEVPR